MRGGGALFANMWNSFHDYVVMSDTINTFKNRLEVDVHTGTLETWRFSILLSCNLHRNRRLELYV